MSRGTKARRGSAVEVAVAKAAIAGKLPRYERSKIAERRTRGAVSSPSSSPFFAKPASSGDRRTSGAVRYGNTDVLTTGVAAGKPKVTNIRELMRSM